MGRPKPPDPMQTARQQQTFNRESQADAAQLGQIGQDTPWGSRSFSGEIGSPDRTETVTLNPQDQARLDQERSIKSRLLGMILGGAQGMSGDGQGMPSQGKQGGGQPMPAMSMNEPQPQPQAPPMAPPQEPMQPQPNPYADMENPPFGILGGGPHGPPGQPSLEEILGRERGLTPPFMRWQ